MIKVVYKGEVIAGFKERVDAEGFLDWKRKKLLLEMNGELVKRIEKEKGFDGRYPGSFPLRVTERYYKEAAMELEKECYIADEY